MDKTTEIFIELLNNKNLTNLRDIKALYLLNVIHKNCEIIKYKNRDIDDYNDEILNTSVKETMLFKGNNYSLTFLYKGIEMTLYRQDCTEDIELSCSFLTDKVLKSDLDYITDFLNSNDIYTKERIVKIKDKLIKSLNDKLESIELYKKTLKAKEEREQVMKKMLYELMEE